MNEKLRNYFFNDVESSIELILKYAIKFQNTMYFNDLKEAECRPQRTSIDFAYRFIKDKRFDVLQHGIRVLINNIEKKMFEHLTEFNTITSRPFETDFNKQIRIKNISFNRRNDEKNEERLYITVDFETHVR